MSTNEPVTQEQLHAIQARLNAAARGPWEHDFCGNVDQVENQSHAISERIADNLTPGDAALIAHAPTDLADLLAEVERLRARLTVDDEMMERAAKALYLSDFMRRNNWATEDRARVSLESAKGGQIGGWMSTLEDARAALHAALNPYETEEA